MFYRYNHLHISVICFLKQNRCIDVLFKILIMNVLQLNPSILVDTPLGRGLALLVIDYGMHQNTCWVVALEKDGVMKHFDCNDVIFATNYTYHMNMGKKSADQVTEFQNHN